MADKKESPWRDGGDNGMNGDTPAEPRRAGERRRRLPLAALVVLLALIAIAIYVAWPAIQESMQSPPLEDAAATAVEADSAPVPLPPVPLPPDVDPPVEPRVEPPVESRVESRVEPPVEPRVETVPPEPSAALLALSAQIAALEKALAERPVPVPVPVPVPAPAALDLTPLTDAVARIEALERRLAEAQPPAPPAPLAPQAPQAPVDPPAPTVARTGVAGAAGVADDFRTLERLDALEDMLRADASRTSAIASAELEGVRADQAVLRAQVAALKEQLESLGQREAGGGRTMMLVLSHTRLARAAAASAPFAREVEALRAAIRSEGGANLALEGAIAELAAHALGGAPTTAGLGATFDDMALAVIRADGAAEEQGWVEATIGRLRRIVTVRRVGGEIAADSLEGRLSAVHGALSAGDLAAAIAVAEALPAKARGGAEDWLRGARARRAVETALGVLDREILARVAAHWNSAGNNGGNSGK